MGAFFQVLFLGEFLVLKLFLSDFPPIMLRVRRQPDKLCIFHMSADCLLSTSKVQVKQFKHLQQKWFVSVNAFFFLSFFSPGVWAYMQWKNIPVDDREVIMVFSIVQVNLQLSNMELVQFLASSVKTM